MNDDMVPEMDDLWLEANEHVNRGDSDKAVEIYRYILIRYVDNSLVNENANAHLGDILLTLGQTDLAEGHIRTALKGEELTGTDAEACAYLMTVSLTQPMDSDWTQIYLYVASQTYRRWGKGEMLADIVVDSISDYQLEELNRLKAWLHRQRSKARMEKDRAERRQKREEAEAQREAEQPALFEF